MSAIFVDDDSSEQYKFVEPASKIGSAPSNAICISGEGVSPVHVRVEKRGEEYFAALEPGGAATRKFLLFFDIPNCTLNRQPLTGKLTKMENGAKLQVGSRLLIFHIM